MKEKGRRENVGDPHIIYHGTNGKFYAFHFISSLYSTIKTFHRITNHNSAIIKAIRNIEKRMHRNFDTDCINTKRFTDDTVGIVSSDEQSNQVQFKRQ